MAIYTVQNIRNRAIAKVTFRYFLAVILQLKNPTKAAPKIGMIIKALSISFC